MATQVGSLYTSLTLESASFIANTKRAADATERMAARIDNAAGLAGAALKGFVAAISVGQIAGIAKAGLDYAASLGETAQQLGVSARALQQYSFAAGQVGVSQEALQTGLARLTKTLGDAKEGSKTASDAFARLGITQDDIKRLSPDEALRRVADGLAKIEDPAKRAAIEVDLFGKSGQKLDNLLSGGTAALDELARSARELGAVLSDEQIAKADEAADKLELVKNVLSANIAGIVADNANSIFKLADAFTTLANAAGRGIGNVSDYLSGLTSLFNAEQQGLAGAPGRIRALLRDPSEIAQIGRNNRFISGLALGGPTIGANGLPGAAGGFAGSAVAPAAAPAASRGGRAAGRAGLSPAQLRLNNDVTPGADTLAALLDPGAVANLDALATSFGEIRTIAVDLSNSEIINPQALAAGQKFAENLTSGLGQAIIYGQSLGDALVSSIKAAAAELVSSGLLRLLGGVIGGGAGGFGGFLGGLFGGGRASGGPVSADKAYVVGENGPELLFGASGQIMSNRAVRGLAGGAGAPTINVDARGATDPAAIEAAARRGAQQGIAAAAQVFGRSQRTSIPRGLV
jgi:hypothetical protein